MLRHILEWGAQIQNSCEESAKKQPSMNNHLLMYWKVRLMNLVLNLLGHGATQKTHTVMVKIDCINANDAEFELMKTEWIVY